MNFGEAIEKVKAGGLVCRAGWNGKGMFIFQRPEDSINVSTVIRNVKSLPQSAKDYFATIEEAQDIRFTAYLCMKAADGSIVNGWLASQTDMLAEDWQEFLIF